MKFTPAPNVEFLSTFQAGDATVFYLRDQQTGTIGLSLVPRALVERMVEHRAQERTDLAWSVDSLVQLKCVGDPYPRLFRQGRTMRDGASVAALRYVDQRVEAGLRGTTVCTTLTREGHSRCEHRLSWHPDGLALECTTTFYNESAAPISLEMLASFSLGGISPFSPDAAVGRLVLHRLRSAWCAEGRLESQPIERLQLESFSYTKVAATERFGQVGSMPVRNWFPFVAVEDTMTGVLWGAQIAWAGSWQLEINRLDDRISLSGGLADRELGHWLKTVPPGGSFTTPAAILATVAGDVDALCARLLSWQEHTLVPPSPADADLPIVFNEWCTTWGRPTHDKLLAIADTLTGSAVRFLVLDAGWYVKHGDWQPNPKAFPQGLGKTVQALRERGFTAGLWFEFENCPPEARAALEHPDHFLTRDGLPIDVQDRWFWDFRDPRVIEFLTENVIDVLERYGIGYLKVDYNDSLGIGCDGAESLGEGLRQHLEGVQAFWRKIRARLPELVIENCASGGHRLEPSMMALSDQASFSDAHEAVNIPIVAANLHRAILPRKSQIWAVLRRGDDQRRLVYSLAATFLGRMGVSGDITELDPAQMEVFRRAQEFYLQARPVVRTGVTRRYGPEILSYRHPTEWQAVVRGNPSLALAVCHGFGAPVPPAVELPLPESRDWQIAAVFHSGSATPALCRGKLICPFDGPWSACAVLLQGEP